MNHRLLLATGAALMCVASVGSAQGIAPTWTGSKPPADVLGQNPSLGQGVPAVPRIGVPAPAALTTPNPLSVQMKPLTPWKPDSHAHAHPGPIEKTGELKAYECGYDLSKYDVTSMQKKSDIPGRYTAVRTPADR
jgi:hypothetical protein